MLEKFFKTDISSSWYIQSNFSFLKKIGGKPVVILENGNHYLKKFIFHNYSVQQNLYRDFRLLLQKKFTKKSLLSRKARSQIDFDSISRKKTLSILRKDRVPIKRTHRATCIDSSREGGHGMSMHSPGTRIDHSSRCPRYCVTPALRNWPPRLDALGITVERETRASCPSDSSSPPLSSRETISLPAPS